MLGLDVRKRDLNAIRALVLRVGVPKIYMTHCMELANVSTICMTNSPFDDDERVGVGKWFRPRPTFHVPGCASIPCCFRGNPLAPQLSRWGYNVTEDLTAHTISEMRRFLRHLDGADEPAVCHGFARARF